MKFAHNCSVYDRADNFYSVLVEVFYFWDERRFYYENKKRIS